MTPELAVAITVAIFGGGGLAALLRLRGETSRVVVDAAEGAVVVQSSVIRDLREQIESLSRRMGEVERRAATAERRAAAAEERARRAEVRAQSAEDHRDLLLRANADLQQRLDHLEAEVRRLGGTLP